MVIIIEIWNWKAIWNIISDVKFYSYIPGWRTLFRNTVSRLKEDRPTFWTEVSCPIYSSLYFLKHSFFFFFNILYFLFYTPLSIYLFFLILKWIFDPTPFVNYLTINWCNYVESQRGLRNHAHNYDPQLAKFLTLFEKYLLIVIVIQTPEMFLGIWN